MNYIHQPPNPYILPPKPFNSVYYEQNYNLRTPAAPTPSTIINIFTEADDAQPRESTTLYGAYQKAKAIASFTSPVLINVFAGTYYETQQIVWDTDLVCLAGVKGYYCSQFILSTNLTNNVPDPITGLMTASAWIYNTSSSGEWYDIYLDSNGNADYCVYVNANSINNGMDIWRCWFLNARLWQCYCAGTIYYSSSNFSLATVVDNGFTSLGAMWIDAGYVIMDYMGITNNPGATLTDWNIYTYFYLTNAAYVQYRVSIIGGYGGTPGTTGNYFFNVDASVADVYSGFVYGFNTYYNLTNASQVSSKNIVYGSGNMLNCDSTSLYSFAGDQTQVSQFSLTGLTVDNCNGFLNDPTKTNKLGFHILGNLSGGNPYLPSESWFGSGSTSMNGAYYLQLTPSTVDLTSSLTMGANIGSNMFASTAVGRDFYIGHTLPFYAIVFNCITAYTTGAISCSYWNGTAWTALNYMFSSGNSPYTSYANSTFSNTGKNFCRFDTSVLKTLWATTNLNSAGNKYYIKFQVTTILGVIPFLEYVQPIFSSSSIKADGNIFQFGKSCTIKNIPFDINLTQGFINAPTNQDIFITKTFGCGRTSNSMAINDVVSGALFLPYDFNSSEPFEIRLAYCGDTSSNVSFTLDVTLGNILNAQALYMTSGAAIAGPTTTQTTQTVTITTSGQNLQFYTISGYLPWAKSVGTTGNTEQILCFTIKRTNASTQKFVIVQLAPYYNSYRTTGINR